MPIKDRTYLLVPPTAVFRTCVSVHRRDRCTCTIFAQLRSNFEFPGTLHQLTYLPLVIYCTFVYLSIDVTGALVLPLPN